MVDDHELFRLGVRARIGTHHPDITIVGEAGNGVELFAVLKSTAADLVLLDIILPDMGGVEIATRLKREYPDLKILVLSSEISTPTIEKLLEIGIDGFVSKFDSSIDTFADAIRSIMDGLEYYGKDITYIISQIYLAKKRTAEVTTEFSEQEKQIITYCHEGLTSKQIANHLHVTSKAIEWHKQNIFRKLGIRSTVEMVVFAVKTGVIRIEN